MSRILVLSGPDGVGKSTIMKLLRIYLHRRGIPTRTCWMRGSHLAAWVLGKLLSKFEKFQGEDNPYFKIRIPTNMRLLWQILETLSGLPRIIVDYVIVPKFR